MAKIKVTAFKESGKYHCEETNEIFDTDYPYWHHNTHLTIDELYKKQSKATYDLFEMIKSNDPKIHKYSPINDFTGFTFVLDGIFENGEGGFLTHLIKR